ncbi:GMC oxidoreductase [Phytomonospora endophytica]|uniref:Choline dehydrogenase-like flavoprotein n=1 Tax=Phytomonospora endophytica TaxID=714109 RepID=A0A841FLJ3_9ACTN|nr:GMC oxidoreductase [Phytomonospora endophytica]MBB6036835.1 choline dehydrogenase-like flavoprotein [Phytomonospora endophytica]GIG68131.1 hypothetical protein Pen01_44260 [Phytomonospora endophytica]
MPRADAYAGHERSPGEETGPFPGPVTTTEEEWSRTSRTGEFDHVVIGSGFCALAFAERVLRARPDARILMLERGEPFLPDHFQNLALPFGETLRGITELRPWRVATRPGATIREQRGMMPVLGGRSVMWSAWCPEPTPAEMRDWPPAVIDAVHAYGPAAKALLDVRDADTLPADSPYGPLQLRLGRLLAEAVAETGPGRRIPSATRVTAAPLAAGPDGEAFAKFATPRRLRALETETRGRLRLVTGCVVSRILTRDGRAVALETSRGRVELGRAGVVLAMGTLPATTLVLNSFPEVAAAGRRFTAHFTSEVVARIPCGALFAEGELRSLELGAFYLAGVDEETGNQYHVQLTAIHDASPGDNDDRSGRHMPDVVASATPEQLADSAEHVVLVAAIVGEMDEKNPANTVTLDPENTDPTTNVLLGLGENDTDRKVWHTMEQATFAAIEQVLSGEDATAVEYWHADGAWRGRRPADIRSPALVHEGSTLWIGESGSPVTLDYRLRGIANVHVTGGALWPTAGSWNPTLTMVALAQDLADRLRAESTVDGP